MLKLKRPYSQVFFLAKNVKKGVANVEIILNGRRLNDQKSVGDIKSTDQNNRDHNFRINIPLLWEKMRFW